VRIYLPATLSLLRDVHAAGEYGPAPVTAFAVTPSLREWYASADLEELEYAAFTDAARASLRLLDLDPIAPRRRVVLAADVSDDVVAVRAELDRAVIRIAAPVALTDLAAVHVDGADAEAAVAAAATASLTAELGDSDAQFAVDSAEDHELEWFAPQEIGDLLGA
jgi:hypothetical protein